MRISVKLQNSLGLEENILLAQLMEHRGLDTVWISEYADRDGPTHLAVLARVTETIDVGASIIPIFTRSPVVLGMTAATLSEAAPGRVWMGLGTSTDVIVERWHGRERERPLTAVRETVSVIRDLLAGERIEHAGDVVEIDGFQHANPSWIDGINIPLAALGPRMRQLAGELGDGVLLNMVSADHLADVRATVEAGADRGDRRPPPLISDIRVGITGPQDPEDLRGSLRKLVASYGRIAPYNRHYAESGFPAQAAALEQAWSERDRDRALAAVDDAMLDSLVAVGSRSQVVDRLCEYADAGLDEAILFPTVLEGDPVEGIQQVIDVAAAVKERLS